MSWTYNPVTTPKDQVRLLIGDTDTTDQQMQDEEIAFVLTLRSDPVSAAANCARTLQAKYARFASMSTDGNSVSWSQRVTQYQQLAENLESQAAALTPPIPYSGGISIADKENNESDPDRVNPQFVIGIDDNPLNQDTNLTATEDPLGSF